MKRIVWLPVILAVFGGAVFAGGTKASSGQTAANTIRWAYWGSESRVKISQEAIDIYQQQNPGVLINPEISGGAGDHFAKVDTQIAGGSGPDIIQMGGNILDYVNKGVLADLTPYSGAGKAIDTSTIDAGAVANGMINGKLYGISTGVSMPALVYNKALLQRAGLPLPAVSMTYEEFRAYLVQLKAKLPQGVWPMQDIGSLAANSTPFGYWSRYNGTPFVDDSVTKTFLTAADAQKYLELFKDYRDNGLVPPAADAAAYPETSPENSAIISGKVAITFVWTSQFAGYQQLTKDELDLIELPGAAEKNALWQPPSQFYTVNKDSKNIEAAARFINFLVNSPEAARVLLNDRGASASSTARAGAASALTPADQKVLGYIASAGAHSSAETPHVPNDMEFTTSLYLIYQSVAFSQKTPAQGGQEILDLLNRMIKK